MAITLKTLEPYRPDIAGIAVESTEVAACVNNILDSHPLLSHMTDYPAATLYYDVTFRPRTLGLQVRWHF